DAVGEKQGGCLAVARVPRLPVPFCLVADLLSQLAGALDQDGQLVGGVIERRESVGGAAYAGHDDAPTRPFVLCAPGPPAGGVLLVGGHRTSLSCCSRVRSHSHRSLSRERTRRP